MKNSLSFSYLSSSNDNIKNDNKKEDQNIICKIIPRKKRNIKIDNKYLSNLKIDMSFVEKALKKINEYRKLHKVAPLILDDYLTKRAFILSKKSFKNFISDDFLYKDGDDLGGNFEVSEEELDADKLIEKWYNENKNYNFIEPIELKCNNFTQMIWKNSNKIGIGYYFSQENKKYYYVALFYPAGNIPGEYKSNVLKKIKEKKVEKNSQKNKKEIELENKEIKKEFEETSFKISTMKIIKFFVLLIVIFYNLRRMFNEKNQLDN